MQKERPSFESHENDFLPSKENLIPFFAAITISGPAGTGKSAGAQIVAQRCGIDTKRFIKTGEIFRQILEGQGEEVLGYSPREQALDKRLDKKQRELLQTATVEKPLVLEGRLAGVIASQIKSEADKKGKPIRSLLFIAEDDIRYQRILKRERKRKPDITIGEVIELTKQREEGDLRMWQQVHPALKGINPFDQNLKDINGKLVYDKIIDTSYLSVEGVADEIQNWMIGNKLLRRINHYSKTAQY